MGTGTILGDERATIDRPYACMDLFRAGSNSARRLAQSRESSSMVSLGHGSSGLKPQGPSTGTDDTDAI